MKLKDCQDAYGHEIYDYFKGIRNFEIVERDDSYFEVTAGARAYLSEYKDWPSHEKEAIKYAKGRVLDIGCGAGRHSLYLQQKGFDVTGVDASPLAIEVCRMRGLKNAEVMPITQISSELGIFNIILMLGNNFALFRTPEEARSLLKKFYGMTSEDGRIIAESIDPYKTELPEHLDYHELNKKRGRMPGQLKIRIRYKKYNSMV